MTPEARREAIEAIVAAAPPPTSSQAELVMRVGLLGEVRHGSPIG